MALETKQSPTKNPVLLWRWFLVAPALLIWWIVGQIDKTNVSLVIADHTFLNELHVANNNAVLGGLMSAFFLGYGISLFIWGFLVDRFGPRACAIVGTLAWTVTMLMSSRVVGINQYLLIRFLLGLAEGNMWPVSNALTNRWFPRKEHSRAQAFWITGSTLGTAIGVPIVTALILAFGWRSALVFLSFLSLLPVLIFSVIKNWPHEQKGISQTELQEIEADRKFELSKGRLSLRELLKSKPFWLITVCQVVSATTIYTMIQWIPTYITRFRHVSFSSMGGWITIGYILATILTLVAGYIGDRTMQRTLTGAWTCVAFVVLVLPACLMLSAPASAVALATLICVPSSLAALNGALLHTLVRPEAVARGTGVYVGIANVMASLGPAIFGMLVSALAGEFWGGFAFLAILNAIGAVCYFALHLSLSTRRTPELLPESIS